MAQYVELAIIWSAWAVLHSALLSLKRFIGALWPSVDCHWRFSYASVSILTILLPLWLTYISDGPPFIDWPFLWPLIVINAAAIALAWAGLKAFGGITFFLGINDRKAACDPIRPEKPISTGILGWIRHPLYSACLILLWAHDMNAARFTVSCVLSAYVLVGTVIEEKRLAREWGEAWRDYRSNVSAFIPVKKIRSMRNRTY